MNFLFVLTTLLLFMQSETMSMINEENKVIGDGLNELVANNNIFNVHYYDDDNMVENEYDGDSADDYLWYDEAAKYEEIAQHELDIAKNILERIQKKTDILKSRLYNRYNEMNQADDDYDYDEDDDFYDSN